MSETESQTDRWNQGTSMTLVCEAPDKSELAAPIEILAWSWGVNFNVESGADYRGRPVTKGFVAQDLSLTKFIDQATPTITAMVSSGAVIKKATLEVLNADATSYVLHNARFTNVSMGGSGGESRFTENITITFEKIDIAFVEMRKTETRVSITCV